MNAPVIFFSPKENAMDFFQENFSVVTQDLSASPKNLKDYSDQAVKQVEVVFKAEIEVLANDDADLAGLPAHKFEYRLKDPKLTLHALHMWTVDNNNMAYQLTYTALESSFDKYWPKVRRMINSFKLK